MDCLLHFSGRLDEDVFSWLAQYERLGQAKGWSEHQLLAYALASLTHQAAYWYDTQSTSSWADFKQQACTRFGPHLDTLIHQFQHLRQQAQQPVQEYTDRFLRIQRHLHTQVSSLPAALQLQKYMHGLKPALRQQLLISCPATVDEAITSARYLSIRISMHLPPSQAANSIFLLSYLLLMKAVVPSRGAKRSLPFWNRACVCCKHMLIKVSGLAAMRKSLRL